MDDRLFVYGTLRPGESNARELDGLNGTWQQAWVRGRFFASGAGAALGYPGVVLDDGGDEVAGMLFISKELSAHWLRLDTFEGEGYRRVVTRVRLEGGETVEAFIYELIAIPPQA